MINYIVGTESMVKMSAHLIVEGLSQTGKNRVREHGDTWLVIGVSENVNALKNTPGILIQSIKTHYVRWMGREKDEDFQIIKQIC